MILGVVDSYDESRGVGVISMITGSKSGSNYSVGNEPTDRGADSSGEVGSRDAISGESSNSETVQDGLRFHCTAISDGTRTVMPGAMVAYSLVPGHFGVMEPYPVVKIDR
jgi:cold shock CspA family protein